MINTTRTFYSRFITCLFLSFILFLPLHSAASADASDSDTSKRVLFISSYSYAWETVPQQIKGIQEALDDDVQLDYKFMDTKNLHSIDSMRLFYESMKQYLKEVPAYDAVIAGDDDAFSFVTNYRDEFFPDIPIAFEGVNNQEFAESSSKDPLICGVTESLSYRNTIDLAHRICPKAQRVVAILDDTITGESERSNYYALQSDYPDLKFDEINTSSLTQKKLKNSIAALSRDSILLYIICSTDADGNSYIGSQGINFVSSAASIPTFSVVSHGLGKGVLGGEIVFQRQMGTIAANMIQKYFDGADFSSFQMVKDTPRTYCFDENVLRHYRINIDLLPKDCTLLNHQATFIEQNIDMIRISVIIGILLLCVMIILLIDNIHRRSLNKELKKAQFSLQNAATYDHLTGLKNRSVFMKTVQEKIEKNEEFTLVLYDIDHFKQINDTLGHNNGDVVLKELAMRTSRICDTYFSVYRLGGDEFTAIIDTTDHEKVTWYVKQIQDAFKQSISLEKQEHFIHTSIGVALYPQDAATQTELIAAADDAMYSVKKNGRNDYAFFNRS